jgi:hypothetical protein
MNRYGQNLTWGTINAPHLFTGKCTGYTYRDATTRQLYDDEAGDHVALALVMRKAALNFSAEVTDGSTDFLDLSAGAAVTATGISAGVVLASRAVETWRLNQRKSASVQATHYPDMVHTGTPATAGTTLDAFTPDQSALSTIVQPGGKVIYSTVGLGHAAGVVHGLTIEQQLTITEDDPSPDGKILGAATHGYLRTIRLELLLSPAATPPAVRSTLALTGAPTHAANYRIEAAEPIFGDKRGKMYAIDAVWIPPFG